jgi:hypothetical protein
LPGRFTAHRGARDPEWSWERDEDIVKGRLSKRPLRTVLVVSALATGITAFAFGLFLLLSDGNGDAAPPIASDTASPTATATAIPTATPTAAPTPRPTSVASPKLTPTPGPAYATSLLSWSETESGWVASELDSSTSDYGEGDLVPFLLRIEDTTPGTTYVVTITYDCLSSGFHAFDYTAGLDDDNTEPLLASPGPGNAVPDSSLVAPDDPTLAFDGPQGSSMKVWGALFSAVGGPTPSTECTGTKSVSLSLSAQDTTLSLVWAGHLASPVDWGTGDGAASATPFGVEVDVNGEVEESVSMLPGAVAR